MPTGTINLAGNLNGSGRRPVVISPSETVKISDNHTRAVRGCSITEFS